MHKLLLATQRPGANLNALRRGGARCPLSDATVLSGVPATLPPV